MPVVMNTHVVRVRQLLLSLALALFMTSCATPATPPHPITPQPLSPQPSQSTPTTIVPQTIVVVGNGNTRVQANLAQVNLGIEVVDDTVLVANRTANEIMERVLDALASQRIAGNDVKPYAYNIYAERYYPDYAIDDPGTVPLFPEAGEETRYRVIHQMHVSIRELERVPEVVDAVIEAGGNSVYIYGTDLLYDDPESLEAAAREKATADARVDAEEIAALLGVELGPAIEISEFVQGSGSMWDNYFMSPLWPGQLEFYMQLQITYATQGSDSAPEPGLDSVAATPAATRPVTGGISETVTIHGGDESSLREFLRQSHISPFVAGTESATALYIATLPPELPFTLEITTGMSIVGSVVTSGESASTQLLFSHDQDVSESVNALRHQLESQGYIRIAASDRQEGFQTQAQDYLPLCSPDGKLAVIVNGRNLPNGTGIVRLFVNHVPSMAGPCGVPLMRPDSEYENVMPSLTAPANIATLGSGMSSGGEGLEVSIAFDGETTIATLADHYYPQLEAQGWQQLRTSQTEEMAWSGWTKIDGDQSYTITLIILRDAGVSNRFMASLRVQRTG